eukprot:UN20243
MYKILNDMKNEKVAPNTIIYNTILSCYAHKLEDNTNQTDEWFSDMEKIKLLIVIFIRMRHI